MIRAVVTKSSPGFRCTLALNPAFSVSPIESPRYGGSSLSWTIIVIADRPRDALLVKILSTAETRCTTNRMELEGYSWPTCSKQPRLVDCRIVVVTNSTVDDDDDEICWQRDRLAVAKFSKSGVWNKVLEGSRPNLIFEDAHISL